MISTAVFGISRRLFKGAAGTLSIYRLNVISWNFYFQIIVKTFIGVNLGVLGVEHYLMSKASDTAVLKAYLAVCYMMVMMPIAMILTQRILYGWSVAKKVNMYFTTALVPCDTKQDSGQIIFWILMSLISILATFYTYYYLKDIPLIAALRGSSALDVAKLRISASRGFRGNVYVRNLLSLQLSPFISYVAYCYLRLRKSYGIYIWFMVMFICAVLALTYSGAKAPVIQFILTLQFIKSFLDGGLKKRDLLLAIGTGVALVVIMYKVLSGDVTISINSGPIGRVLMSEVAGLPLTFDTFPQEHSFLRGASFPAWMVTKFGMNHVRSARLLMEVYNPRGVSEGVAGVMNTIFLGEAWANFGWIGLLISPIVVGIVVQVVYGYLLSRPKNPVYVAAMGYFMFNLPLTGGFVDFIWNASWLFLAVLILLSHTFSLIFRLICGKCRKKTTLTIRTRC
jgi:oligosaccharide repeat unit polymerase